MNKTAAGLVEWAKRYRGHPYWYGMFGHKASKEYFVTKLKQYPSHYNRPERQSRYMQHISQNREVFDCIGLIKGYLWWNGHRVVYDPNTDVSANGMRAKAKRKGPIHTMPDKPGLLVWYSGHIGVYIGGGEVIEARGFDYGVVQTRVSQRAWREWMECPYLAYKTDEAELTLEVNNRNIPVEMEYVAAEQRNYVELEGKNGQKHMIKLSELARVLGAQTGWDANTRTAKLFVR